MVTRHTWSLIAYSTHLETNRATCLKFGYPGCPTITRRTINCRFDGPNEHDLLKKVR